MHDEVEAAVCEHTEVGHVTLDGVQLEPVTRRYAPVLLELAGSVVEDGDARTRRSQDRPLLPATRGEAEHLETGELGKPRPRHGLGFGEDDVPVAAARRGDDFGADWLRPGVARLDLRVPGLAVVVSDIHKASSGKDS